VAKLQALATSGDIRLIQHPSNLGFIRGMNQAMQLDPRRDLVWLNADTRVSGNWLDRLRETAYSQADIAGASPLSNNGEMTNLPYPDRPASMPSASEQEAIDRLAAASWNGNAPELPMACGFCFYLRRDALDQVGLLDEEHLIKGYGEDSDWSLRARAKGWRLLAAPQVFVAHRGSVSFAEHKRWWVDRNNAIVKQRYPLAEKQFEDFRQQNPLHAHRQRLQLSRLLELTSEGKTVDAMPLLVLGPLGWNHPALPHAELDLPDPDDPTPRPIDAQPWLYWTPSNGPSGGTVTISIPVAQQALPIVLKYVLPKEFEELNTALDCLKQYPWQLHDLRRLPEVLLRFATNQVNRIRLRPIDDSLERAAAAEASARAPRQQQLLALVQKAEALILPTPSLNRRYAQIFPQTPIQETDSPPYTVQDSQFDDAKALTEGISIVIGDRLDNPEINQAWLNYARTLALKDKGLGYALLLHGAPAARELRATGSVIEIAKLSGLSVRESVKLSGACCVLSLDANPGPGWAAPGLSRLLDLPLLAPQSNVAKALRACITVEPRGPGS
jgi:GT2 family glycosyltransferase